MSLIPFPIGEFGGLNLVSDALDLGVSDAVDLLNVDFDRQGVLRTRNGSGKFNGNTLSGVGYQALFPSPLNGGELLAVRPGSGGVDKVSTAGVVANVGAITAGWALGSAVLGTPTSTIVYLPFVASSGTSGNTIVKYDGSTVSTGTGKPLHVATWPVSNRLVQGGYFAAADSPSGANGSRHTVFFSDPGAPDTFGANNFVTLRPGDGEVISAIVPFRDLLFVFKQSAMFVFYGESIDSTGNPIFNYRRVDLPEPVVDPLLSIGSRLPRFAITGPDAVYYSTPRGIYRTTGGVPELLTSAISPMFSSDTTNVSTSVSAGTSPVSLSWANDRLIGAYTSVAGSVRQIVWHAPTAKWTIWTLAGASCFTVLPAAGVGSLVRDLVFFTNGNDIWVMSPAFTTDNGVAITWSFTTGYSNAGGYFRQRIISSGERKRHFKTDIEGSGTVTHQVLALNARPTDQADPGGSVALGTAPAIARGSRRRGVRGTYFAHKLSGTGPALVSGLTYWLANVEGDT